MQTQPTISQAPLISVIVPVYNKEKYLAACIESIQQQSYINIEIILVDDGSTDRCGAICDEYANKDNRIKVIHLSNGGCTRARRIGLEASHGEWVAFVDADDQLLPHAIASLHEQSDGVEVVSGNTIVYREIENRKELMYPEKISKGVYTGQEFITQLLTEKRLHTFWRMLIRSDVLATDMLNTPRTIYLTEDLLFNLQLGLRIKSCRNIEDVVYHYNDYPQNTVHQVKRTKEYYEAFDLELMKIFSDSTYYQLFAEYIFHYRVNRLGECFFHLNDAPTLNYIPQLQQDKQNNKLKIREKVILFCIKIRNAQLRHTLWTGYSTISKTIYLSRKKLKELQMQ